MLRGPTAGSGGELPGPGRYLARWLRLHPVWASENRTNLESGDQYEAHHLTAWRSRHGTIRIQRGVGCDGFGGGTDENLTRTDCGGAADGCLGASRRQTM